MPRQPLAEVFGYPVENTTPAAAATQTAKLCPFGNIVPQCTKSKKADPLGVCSVLHGDPAVPYITCPVRFREGGIMTQEIADWMFPAGATWKAIPEMRLYDSTGRSVGNIDLVMAQYDPTTSALLDFGAVEVQGVYISNNVTKPFKRFMANPTAYRGVPYVADDYPRPDPLSSRKRLIAQLVSKGSILHTWQKKIAVVVQPEFFATLPAIPVVPQAQANMAWFLYDLAGPTSLVTGQRTLTLNRVVYTDYTAALSAVSTFVPGPLPAFQKRVRDKI